MSQIMNQQAAKKKKKHSRLPEVEEPVELSGAEKLFEQVKPHLTTIGLVVVASLLGFIAIAVLMRSRFDKNALQWREFATSSTIALRTGDINGLKQVAETYPNTKAGLWSLQMAGDQQLRMGIEQLSFDREAGLGMIKKAKANFQSIVDAPEPVKTTMLDRRSLFSLAYASESLGELAEAKALYEQLVTQAPDSAFSATAQRGFERTSNEEYATLFAKFANWEEEVIGDAPGPPIPPRPVIDLPPEFSDLSPGEKPPTSNPDQTSGGDFDTEADNQAGSDDSANDAAEKEKEANSDLPRKDDSDSKPNSSEADESIDTEVDKGKDAEEGKDADADEANAEGDKDENEDDK